MSQSQSLDLVSVSILERLIVSIVLRQDNRIFSNVSHGLFRVSKRYKED